MSKKLATIQRTIPEVCSLEYIDELKRKDFDRERLYELFKRLEFKSFIEKYHLAPQKEVQAMPSKQFGSINRTEELNNIKETIKDKKKFALYYLMDKADSFNNRLAGMGITSEEDSFYIELGGSLDEDEFLNEFKDIFQDAGIKKIGHDMKNFIVHLKNKGIDLNGLAFDTMIGAYILNPSRETYDISELAGEYLGIDIEPVQELTGKGKNFTPFGNLPVEKVSSAAVNYSEIVYKAKTIIEERLAENGQLSLYQDIELPLVEVLADMEHVGFKVNTEDLKSFSAELESRINQLINEIYFMAGEEFNINSTKQLGVILFEKLKLPVIKKTKTGYSTDADVLEQLEPMHEIVAKLLEYRQLVKLKSTYVEGLLNVLNPKTGRIHSSFNQTVTVTGRISSTEPNLQNIPIKLEMGRKIRKVFVPGNEGYCLVGGDYSQMSSGYWLISR
jgi:DNA polymerase-1